MNWQQTQVNFIHLIEFHYVYDLIWQTSFSSLHLVVTSFHFCHICHFIFGRTLVKKLMNKVHESSFHNFNFCFFLILILCLLLTVVSFSVGFCFPNHPSICWVSLLSSPSFVDHVDGCRQYVRRKITTTKKENRSSATEPSKGRQLILPAQKFTLFE